MAGLALGSHSRFPRKVHRQASTVVDCRKTTWLGWTPQGKLKHANHSAMLRPPQVKSLMISMILRIKSDLRTILPKTEAIKMHWQLSVALTLLLGLRPLTTQALHPECNIRPFEKPRVFILSDISNEPDDAQSMVRLMVYANELDIQGLVATTSVWLNDSTRPDQIHDIVDTYEKSIHNLRNHADGWPDPDYLRGLVCSGLPVYGMDGVGEGKDSEGSRKLVQAVDASEKTLWVLVWGGASVLAQTLWHVNATRQDAEIREFVSKLRVYSISDQDNTGTWIRRNWPQLFYIASIHHFNRYAMATWGGISGETYYHFLSTADQSVISPEWVRRNIQSVGDLGLQYPDSDFILEGDTPSLLYLIPNGLSDPEYPEWGSWGGRYGPVNYGEAHFADSVDTMVDEESGRIIMGSHLTIWRWRSAFQHDFAARMQWSAHHLFTDATHAPVASIDGDASRNIVKITTNPGKTITLDASSSCDPDNNSLSYKWWQYLEPSSNNNAPKRDVAQLGLDGANSPKIIVTIPPESVFQREGRNTHPEPDKHLHLILEVSNGRLVSYRRIVFTIPGPGTLSGNQENGEAHDEL
ncbi:hypothetical protein V1505DRAFT_411200 [Lipomyces doorenjongii]